MPDFAKLQQNAKKMFQDLSLHFSSSYICFNFFSNTLIPANSALEDAYVIGLLACSLDVENDRALRCYLSKYDIDLTASNNKLENFKTLTLLGIYLFKWSYYSSSSVAYYINKPIIVLFQTNLEIESPIDLGEELIDASLRALSQYCSYIYENRYKEVFDELNNQLGATIQVEIHNLNSSKFVEDTSWYGVYAEIMHTLGRNKMS